MPGMIPLTLEREIDSRLKEGQSIGKIAFDMLVGYDTVKAVKRAGGVRPRKTLRAYDFRLLPYARTVPQFRCRRCLRLNTEQGPNIVCWACHVRAISKRGNK